MAHRVDPDAFVLRRCAMKRLLLAAAGLSVLAGPMAASAQPQQDRPENHQDQNRGSRQAPASREQGRQAPQNFRGPQQNYSAPQQNYRQFQQPTQPRGGFSAYGKEGAHTTWRGAGQYGSPLPAQPNRGGQYQRYGGTGQVQSYRGGQYQYRNGGQYQYRSGAQNYRNWSGSNVRLRGDWWRGRSDFRGYYGRREGFWFAPGYGYYEVDPRWWGFDWVVGSIVPYDLQEYAVSDYWNYGLPAPPYGCEWIFLGDQIVLIDLGSGAILEVAGAF
jgi:Ni/Co efflux regulator RcnB